jgi:hypothetical protein
VMAFLIIATALAAVAVPQRADAATLKGQLRHAKLALRTSKDHLEAAEAALAAALAGDTGLTAAAVSTDAASPSPTPAASPAPVASSPSVAVLKAKVAKARHAVRVWDLRVRRLAKQYRLERRMASWELHHQWMPIIEVAAAKYHVKADGMYRMMMRESGGQQYAGSNSSFKGLFQYYSGTWSSSWNPWRQDDIFDASSQIFATAYAISKGMGPSMWTTTFASQY